MTAISYAEMVIYTVAGALLARGQETFTRAAGGIASLERVQIKWLNKVATNVRITWYNGLFLRVVRTMHSRVEYIVIK